MCDDSFLLLTRIFEDGKEAIKSKEILCWFSHSICTGSNYEALSDCAGIRE